MPQRADLALPVIRRATEMGRSTTIGSVKALAVARLEMSALESELIGHAEQCDERVIACLQAPRLLVVRRQQQCRTAIAVQSDYLIEDSAYHGA